MLAFEFVAKSNFPLIASGVECLAGRLYIFSN